ncbi:MAG TPA: DUF5131 family protein, partial [Bacillota bacterium]
RRKVWEYILARYPDSLTDYSPEHPDWAVVDPTRADGWPLPNVVLMTSISTQDDADKRLLFLLRTPAAMRGVSVEPMLSAIDPTRYFRQPWLCEFCYKTHYGPRLPADWDLVWQSAVCPECQEKVKRDGGYGKVFCGAYATTPDPRPWKSPLHWIVAGGETGPGARPMHPDWVRGLRDQCQAAGVPFYFKGWGEWVAEDQSPEDILLPGRSWLPWCKSPYQGDQTAVYMVGKRAAGRLLDGREHNEMPEVRP